MMLAQALAKLGATGCSIPKTKGVPTEEIYQKVQIMTPDGLQPPSYTWQAVKAALYEVESELAFEELRKERNARLAKTDFLMFPDVQVQDKDAWLSYRQALRDLPSVSSPKLLPGTQNLDPDSVNWPATP